MLRGENLAVQYARRLVFGGVDISIAAGRFIALIGPNGSGKSSLLRLLSGLQKPAAGRVIADVCSMLIAPAATPPADLTPVDLASYGLALRRRPWEWGLSPSAQARVAAALERCGLTAHAHTRVANLSAGEVQRAWIAAALAVDADVLLIDEPTTHLDLRFQMEVLCTLKALTQSGMAVMVAMHDLTLAGRFADDVALLAQGALRWGAIADVLTQSYLNAAFGVTVDLHRHPQKGYWICLPA